MRERQPGPIMPGPMSELMSRSATLTACGASFAASAGRAAAATTTDIKATKKDLKISCIISPPHSRDEI
jgi:hypothetical protein